MRDSNGQYKGRLATVAVVLSTVLLGVPATLWAQTPEIGSIRIELQRVGKKLTGLSSACKNSHVSDPQRGFKVRLSDAETMFLLGDYDRASLVLFNLVGTRFVDEPRFADAVYYLAESQFQMGNDLSARDLFRKLIERRDRRYLKDSVLRLVTIADRTQQWEGLDANVSLLRQSGRLPPSIAYIHAKSLLRQGKYRAVFEAASDVPSQHPIYPKIRYLVAVAILQMTVPDPAKSLVDARNIFTEIAKVGDQYDDAETLRDLGAMNRGRLYLEQGKITEAIDAYQQVKRSSAYFPRALYEISWIFVRSASEAKTDKARLEEYRKARKSLDILLLLESKTKLAPEARILLGGILLLLEQHDEAAVEFQRVVDEYMPLREHMRKLSADVVDPEAYYTEIVERTRTGGELLPTKASKWAAEQTRLKKALAVVSDIDRGDQWIADARAVADKLIGVLDSGEETRLFPALREAQVERLAIESTLVGLNNRMLSLARNLLANNMSAAEQGQLQAILDRRAALAPAYAKLPKSQEEYEGRVASMRQHIRDVERTAYRLQWDVEKLRRILGASRQWLAANPELGRLKRRTAFELIKRGEADVQELDRLQKELVKKIEDQAAQVSVVTSGHGEEESVRQGYVETLQQERELLEAVAKRGTNPELQALQGQQGTLVNYHAVLGRFRRCIAAAVQNKVSDTRAAVLKEQSILDAHTTAINAERARARQVVGEIAIGSLKEVEDKFDNIVLRGDVGIINVAWAQKENKTHAISRKVGEQRRELQILDAEFQEILGEE